jgi:hypothetical protein
MRSSVSTTNRSWIAKRNKAIERLMAAWDNYEDPSNDDLEPIEIAIDAITVAHIAAALEWENTSIKRWEDEKGKAMVRLVRAWIKYNRTHDDPEAEEELNIALDALTIAHAAATFEWASGPLKW